MKNRINWFIACIITVTLLLCVAGCQDFLIQVNSGNAIININLDLSKLIKNSRNDDTQINGYVLKLFVYDAKNYQEGDREIEKLPLLTQTSNKVDINGTVKASLEVAIDSTVIFVGKLFTLNENNVESDKPLYAGKSEVFKVQPKDNKVHLVLSREKSEIGFEIELAETHKHTFADSWSTSLSHHWKGTTCGHTDVMSEFANHSFGVWEIKDATETEVGSKERTCSVCKYKEIVEIAQLAHTHKFAYSWTTNSTYHWKAADCEHKDIVSDFGEHVFEEWTTTIVPTEEETGIREQVCSDCYYKKTEQIEKNPAGFVYVKAGTFQMGSNAGPTNEQPVQEVTITKDFYMGKYEVTQAEYEKYCSYTGSYRPNSTYRDGENYPAYYVSWYDALVYCNKRSMEEGLTPCYSISDSTDPNDWGSSVPTTKDDTWNAATCNFEANGYRLPTEAEWEYAARAGDNTTNSKTYSGTSDVTQLGDYAWYTENSGTETHKVGTRKANSFGLYDMTGNVSEWCWNWVTDGYNTGTEGVSDPTGASSGESRVLRGGCFVQDSGLCAVSYRNYFYPNNRNYFIGFRVVRSAN